MRKKRKISSILQAWCYQCVFFYGYDVNHEYKKGKRKKMTFFIPSSSYFAFMEIGSNMKIHLNHTIKVRWIFSFDSIFGKLHIYIAIEMSRKFIQLSKPQSFSRVLKERCTTTREREREKRKIEEEIIKAVK